MMQTEPGVALGPLSYQEAETGQSYGVPQLMGQRAGREQRTLEAWSLPKAKEVELLVRRERSISERAGLALSHRALGPLRLVSVVHSGGFVVGRSQSARAGPHP